MGVYDQFIWFGDSLTQQAWGGQEGGFGAGAAMQNCEFGGLFFPLMIFMWRVRCRWGFYFPLPLMERVEFCRIFVS